jgi:DNA-directed RNA polymerase specialized sigma24 family protein
MAPARDDEVLEPRAAEMLALAERAPNQRSALLLRNFLGVLLQV